MMKSLKIREKVLLVVISVSLASLLSMTVTSYFTIRRVADYSESVNHELGEKAIEGADGALYVQAHAFLNTIATGRSNAADLVLDSILLNTELLEGAVRDIFSNPGHYGYHTLAHASEAVEGADTSTWMLSERYELTAEIKREIELLSNLDMIMPTLKSDPNILQLYVGTKNGLAYTYSSMRLDNPGFDPRERPWYKEALLHPHEAVFTGAYESAFGAGMVLTAAKAVYKENGELVGVVGLDICLEDLKRYMLATHVSDTGYVFIMDGNGNYVVHPDIGKEGFSVFRDVNDEMFAEGYRRMMNGEKGFVREEVDGRFMYLAFSPMSVTNWSVGAIAPEDEMLSAKNVLSSQMELITDQAAADMSLLSEKAIWIFAVIFLLCIFVVSVVGIYLTRIISRPIGQLANDVSSFGSGEFEYRASVKTNDEIGYLAGIFNQMADNIVKNMAELAEITAAKERLNSELRVAAKIQNDMLPDVNSKFANHPSVKFFASVEPALEMGGDLYDVFFVDKEQRKLCAVVADVSGKGVPSAMFMVMSKTLIRNYMLSGENPSEALRKTNNILCEDNLSNMFITTYISLTDLDTGECQYSHAGHNPVAYCPRNGEFYYVKTDKTMPLGLIRGNKYPLYSTTLKPGDKFFHYTDGITEALDENDELWGEEALLKTLNANRKLGCSEIAAHVREGVAAHAGNTEQSDDITILVLEFGVELDSMIIVKNHLDELDRIYELLREMSETYGLSQDIQNDLCICVDEVFSNIVKYAYEDKGEHDIKVEFDFDGYGKKITITMMDDGKAFNPMEVKSPDLSLNLLEREIGGLGVFIVSNIMSSVKYSRLDNSNKLEMVKDV